jgi:hypothetical protein
VDEPLAGRGDMGFGAGGSDLLPASHTSAD